MEEPTHSFYQRDDARSLGYEAIGGTLPNLFEPPAQLPAVEPGHLHHVEHQVRPLLTVVGSEQLDVVVPQQPGEDLHEVELAVKWEHAKCIGCSGPQNLDNETGVLKV